MENDKDINETLSTNWTSIDLYYKGFHIKKSFPENVKMDQLIKTIDTAIEKGFKPSWNEETSKKQLNDDEGVAVEDNATCPIHKVALRHFIKDDNEWWSHQLQNGKWCNGRDTKYNKEL